MSLDFWQGIGIKHEPEIEDVLDCLCSDASLSGDSFEDFCANCGYDVDSRKAYKLFRQCVRQTERFKRLLAADFETFVYAERN